MENSKSEELISGLATAFIDQSSNSNLAYRPEFIYNDHKQRLFQVLCKHKKLI